jgi:transcriptional regulator with XRE-family HTH domain
MPSRDPTISEAKANIAAWVRNFLRQSGWSQVQLAEKLGVTEATISNVVTGKFKPGFTMTIKLALHVGMPLYDAITFRTPAHSAAPTPALDHQTKAAGRK